MRVGLFFKVLPMHLAIASLFVLPLWQRHVAIVNAQAAGKIAQSQLASQRDKQETQPIMPVKIEGLPVRILIPRLGIDLPIVTGTYDQASSLWSVAPISANYAPNTAKNNNIEDTTLIYGHAIQQVFGRTSDLLPADVVYVYTDNGHIFKYEYSDKNIVKPSDVEIFNNLEGKPGLVLLTCDGNWSQNRRLMYFNLVESQ